MSTALAVAVPHGLALPAHLQTPEAAAQIAKANAEAAGGIKLGGGFPKISIEGGKFHEIDAAIENGAPRTYMVAAQPGQPPLPMMCLEAVIIAANPALVKTFYAKKWQKGDAEAPDCQSSNGVTPDAHVVNKQSAVCATCPQNQWGSKISEATGKEVKACTDSKQMAILPGADLTYKALGLAVTPSALGDWGKYVAALSERNIPVNSVVTNITFDHTASYPKLKFAFNRFLTAEEYAQVQKRIEGDDVKAIVNPQRSAAPALPAPAAAPQLASPAPAAPAPAPAYVPPPAPPAPPAPPPAGFGATTAATAAPAAPAAQEAPKRGRRSRAEIDAANAAAAASGHAAGQAVDLSYLPPAIKAAVDQVGASSPAGIALLAQFPRPAAPAPQAAPESVPASAPPAPAPAASGFGAATAAPAAAPVGAGVAASGASLKDILAKKLGLPPTPPAGQ